MRDMRFIHDLMSSSKFSFDAEIFQDHLVIYGGDDVVGHDLCSLVCLDPLVFHHDAGITQARAQEHPSHHDCQPSKHYLVLCRLVGLCLVFTHQHIHQDDVPVADDRLLPPILPFKSVRLYLHVVLLLC